MLINSGTERYSTVFYHQRVKYVFTLSTLQYSVWEGTFLKLFRESQNNIPFLVRPLPASRMCIVECTEMHRMCMWDGGWLLDSIDLRKDP